MIKKSLNAMSGVKGIIETTPKGYKRKKLQNDRPSNMQREICLNCKKPAKECKGDCFGGR